MEGLLNFDKYPIYRQESWDAAQLGDVPYMQLTIGFIVLIFVIEFYLDWRQLGLFTSASLPKELVAHITPDTFKKSNAYGKDKFAFKMVESVFTFVMGVAFLLLGYLPYAWDLSKQIVSKFGILNDQYSDLFQEIVITWIFVVVLTLWDTVTSLPFSLYGTFVVEQKHGFNKTTLGLFFQDKAMTLGLTFVLGMPILSLLIWIVRMGGPHFYYYVWVFLAVVSIILMTVYPTLIAPLFNKYTKLEDGEVKTAIEDLAKKVSFPLTNLFTVDGSKRSAHSNAYFYGFFKNKRIVLYDTLLKQVELPELLAILGHEIGHWKLWHTVQGFFISQIYTFALFLAFSHVQNTPGLFAAFGFGYTDSSSQPMPVFIGLMLFSQTFWSPVEKLLSLAMTYNSRSNEFAADAYAVSLDMGAPLATGLIKISIGMLLLYLVKE
jgi:STE24 endopeptidase